MPDVAVLPILVATVAAFILSSTFYSVFGSQLATVSEAAAAGEQPPPWKIALELLRSAILATIVAGIAVQGGIDDVAGGLALGLALWLGFPLVLWTRRRLARQAPRRGGDRQRLVRT